MGPKLRSSLAGVVVVMALGGCANQAAPRAAGSTGGTGSTSSWAAPTPSSTPRSMVTAKVSPSKAEGPAARRLASALYDLSSQMRTVQSSSAPVASARHDLGQALSAMRVAVKRERVAAYGTSGRSCSAVGAQLAATRAGRSDVTTAHGKLKTAVTARAGDLDRLQADIAAVGKALAARGTSTAGASAADVRAAIASAKSQAQDNLAQLRGVGTAAEKAVATADHLQAQAERIAGKAC